MRHRTTTSIDVDGIEVELDHNPEFFEPITIQPTPDTLVVGYLMYDQDCENPLTAWDGEGRLYTYGAGVITDDSSAPSKLGLNSFPGRNNWRRHYPTEMDFDLELDGIFDRIAEKVTAKIKADPEMSAWMVASVMQSEAPMEKLVDDLVNDQFEGSIYCTYDWSSDEDQDMLSRLAVSANEAWQELYNEGKIGEYLAVPVDYCHSVHGPGTASAYTTSLDNANAVWVPDKCSIENMNFDGCVTYLDKLAVADKYAASVLEEYVKWCNGECYGIVTETFVLTDDGESYEKVGETDSCWGFIGQEWAEEALKEQVGWCVEKLKEREAA